MPMKFPSQTSFSLKLFYVAGKSMVEMGRGEKFNHQDLVKIRLIPGSLAGGFFVHDAKSTNFEDSCDVSK